MRADELVVKGIVFDMDGLMFDTERLAVQAWEYTGQQLGIVISSAFVVQTLGLNLKNSQRVFEAKMGAGFNYLHARQIKLDYMTAFIEEHGLPVKTGLLTLLDFLRANRFKMTVATSNEADRAWYFLRKSQVDGYFGPIVCGDMIERGKPEPDIYLKACEMIGLAPEHCLALEDSPLGIQAASRAGLKPVMIPDLVQPTTEISRLLYAQLPTLHNVIGLLAGT